MGYSDLSGRIIDATPVPARGMISWNDAVAKLCALTDEQKHSLNGLVDAVVNHPDLSVRDGIRKAKEEPRSDLHERFALMGAVTQCSLSSYVRNRHEAHAHRVQNILWTGNTVLWVHPVSVALTGKFIPHCYAFPGHAIENDFVNAGLWVPEKEYNKLVGLRGGSVAELRRKAQSIIETFIVRYGPDHKLTYKQFRSQMREHFSGAIDARLHTVWKSVIPDAWKGGGRPRKLPSWET